MPYMYADVSVSVLNLLAWLVQKSTNTGAEAAIYLLYRYKSTHTDAEALQVQTVGVCILNLLGLLVHQ